MIAALRRNLGRFTGEFTGEAVRQKVMAGSELITASSRTHQIAAWMKGTMA